MARPWEKYQQQAAQDDGPWAKYAQQPTDQSSANFTPQQRMQRAYAGMRTPEQSARATYDDSPWYARPFVAAGGELTSVGQGIGQLLTPDNSGVGKSIQSSVDNQAAAQSGIHGVSGFIGRALPYVATIPLGGPEEAALARLPAGASALARLGVKAGTAALEGAGWGAAQATQSGQSRGENALLGALGGAGGRGITAGIGSGIAGLASAVPERVLEGVAVAKRFGIPLHLSQLTDSIPAKTAASMAKYFPGTGAGKLAQRQSEAFNDALSQTMGNAPGINRPLSDAAMAATKARIGNDYNQIFNGVDVSLSPQRATNIANAYNQAQTSLSSDEMAVVGKNLDKIVGEFGNGPISGSKYQSIRESLRQAAANNPGKVGNVIKALRDELDAAAKDSLGSPDKVAALDRANGQWANMRTVQKGLEQAQGAKESVAPGNLWNLVKKGSTRDMRDLARLGKGVLQDPIPDSGTAGRYFIGNLMGGAGGAPFTHGATLLPAAAQLGAGITLGRLLNSEAGANALLGASRVAQRLQQPAPVPTTVLGKLARQTADTLPQRGPLAAWMALMQQQQTPQPVTP